MSSPVRSALPRSDRYLLQLTGSLVPAEDRAEWLRLWEAELWWRRHPIACEPPDKLLTDLSVGLCRDALWLRVASWERMLRGTAALCVLLLSCSCIAAVLLAFCLYGGCKGLSIRVDAQFAHFLFAGPLVIFVTFATATRRPVNSSGRGSAWIRLRRGTFFAIKLIGMLSLAYLLSIDVCAPLAFSYPSTSDYIQMLFFVLVSICALRWAFQDQERRCKACLRLLSEPSRVGKPSHNLLNWSGTELICRRGHGLLSIPELETSWHQSSEWINDAAV